MEFGGVAGGPEIPLMYIIPEDCGKIRLNFENMELFVLIIGNKNCYNYEKRVANMAIVCYNDPTEFIWKERAQTMKRVLSLALAMAMMLTVIFCAGITASADPVLTVSDECINILKAYEGFCKYPYWDYGQWTVGYGTRCPADKLDTYKQNGITEEEAEALLRVFVADYEEDLIYFINKYNLPTTQNQFDAMFLMSYNCGSGWIYSPSGNFHKAMADPNTDPAMVLYQFGTWSNAGDSPMVGLIKRRLAEANMYLNGVYSKNRPANFCYVIYEPAGGALEDCVHAYNVELGATAPLVPVLDGYLFQGWFSEPAGGTRITTLDASTDGKTLYARWVSDGTSPELPNPGYEETPLETPVVVKVTTDELNLRQGPGTHFAPLSVVTEGTRLTVTATSTDDTGRLWGKTPQGWACLEYTDYASGGSGQPVVPDNPEAPPVQPEQPTEPVTPPADEPADPEFTADANATVVANGCLYIRQGPGTGYDKVGEYPSKSRIRILEQKSSGISMWGKTDKGWVSMAYVRMDADNEAISGGVTGTVQVQGALRVRKGAGTGYGIAGYYYNGATVTILEQVVSGAQTWGKTSLGWISMDYVNLGSDHQTNPPEQNPAAGKTGVITASGVLNIRAGAGTGYAISGYYNRGDIVAILEEKQVGGDTWGKTDKGWISMSYVQLMGQSDSEGDLRTVTAGCLNVRAEAGTGSSVVGYLYRGTKVKILEQMQLGDVLWGKTQQGWIALSYTE